MNETAQILVRHDVDLKTFNEEIRPAARPVILKGLIEDWPIVRAGRDSARALADCLRAHDGGKLVPVTSRPAGTDGHLFYSDDMTGFNFSRSPGIISATVERLLAQGESPDAPPLFIDSVAADKFLPTFAAAHPMPLVDPRFTPRIWIGNRVKVQTHFDLKYNIACVVGGRRRFTVFPPGQIVNLYPGPIEFTPSGVPLSMVPFVNPDLARYPRYTEALRHAQSAELEPGDAIFLPYAWWHHVESLAPFNVLVNYWWNDAAQVDPPYAALLHAAITVRDMPADQRAVWHGMFEHYIFGNPDETLRHLAPEHRGLLGPPSPRRTREAHIALARIFTKPPSA
jgi:hypothetical protein